MRHSAFTTGAGTTTSGSFGSFHHPRHHLGRKVDPPVARRSVEAWVAPSGGAGAVRMGAAEAPPTAAVEADPSIRLVGEGLPARLALEWDLTASADVGLQSDASMRVGRHARPESLADASSGTA